MRPRKAVILCGSEELAAPIRLMLWTGIEFTSQSVDCMEDVARALDPQTTTALVLLAVPPERDLRRLKKDFPMVKVVLLRGAGAALSAEFESLVDMTVLSSRLQSHDLLQALKRVLARKRGPKKGFLPSTAVAAMEVAHV